MILITPIVLLIVGNLLSGGPVVQNSSAGIASRYQADAGIEKDPDVLFAENFESGSTKELAKRWSEISDKDGAVVSLVEDSASGKRAVQLKADLAKNTGGHLYRRLPRGVDTLFARFYVKFPDKNGYIHHFVHLGGYNPPTGYPQGGAGDLPKGNERMTVGIEPFGDYGKFPAPGAWNFYAYWQDMKRSADGRYWGQSIAPVRPMLVPQGRWQCVEVMMKCNTAPEKSDGELALWLDGKLAMHVATGVRREAWTGLGFRLPESGGEPFEGFRWRSSLELKINFFWLLHYVTASPYKQNRIGNPPDVTRALFDDIVLATRYIGPRTR